MVKINAAESYELVRKSNRYKAIKEDIKSAARRGSVSITVELPSWAVQSRLREEGYSATPDMGYLTISWDVHKIARQKQLLEEIVGAQIEEADLPEHGTRAWWGRLLRRCKD